MQSTQDAILDLAGNQGRIRSLILDAQGPTRISLKRLVEGGQLAGNGPGISPLPDRPVSYHSDLAAAARQDLLAGVCLLSVLPFQKLTVPGLCEALAAIPQNARSPRLNYPPIRIVRFAEVGRTKSVEERETDGAPVRIMDIAQTMTDCFKYLKKNDLDVALEALTEAMKKKRGRGARGRQAGIDKIRRPAQPDPVANYMRPYREAQA